MAFAHLRDALFDLGGHIMFDLRLTDPLPGKQRMLEYCVLRSLLAAFQRVVEDRDTPHLIASLRVRELLCHAFQTEQMIHDRSEHDHMIHLTMRLTLRCVMILSCRGRRHIEYVGRNFLNHIRAVITHPVCLESVKQTFEHVLIRCHRSRPCHEVADRADRAVRRYRKEHE